MNDKKIREWGKNLLDRLNKDWDHVPESIFPGYAIFYSPIKYQPDLLIIGDNPGGNELYRQTEIPTEHEYFEFDYSIAYAMKNKIFSGERLNNLLRNSVKTNRIFFKTRDLTEFNALYNSKYLESYCFQMLKEIILTLEPKLILAESFGTFRKISTEEQIILKKDENSKSLLLAGTHNNIPVLGINHPSRASYHKINDIDWQKVNKKLNEII